MSSKMKKKLRRTIGIVLSIIILFGNGSIGVSAASDAVDISLSGIRVTAEDAEEFLRYGFDDEIVTTQVTWQLTNVRLAGNSISMTIDNGAMQEYIEGEVYLAYNQADGYNYVVDMDSNAIDTLYFSICEKIETQMLFNKNVLEGFGLIWYLYDDMGDLYVFEQEFSQNVIDIRKLANITIAAPKESDTMWFVYKMEPVSSCVLEPEDGISLAEISDSDTVAIGGTYQNSFYLTGMLIQTTCKPYMEVNPGGNAPNFGSVSGWTTNLRMHQKVTRDGVDITGSISNVFSFEDVSYSIVIYGNAKITVFTPTWNLTTWKKPSLSEITSSILELAPSQAQTAMSIAELMATLISSGNEVQVSSETITTSAKGYKYTLNPNYYLAYDGDYLGCGYTLATEDNTKARNTTATVGIKFTYTVVGGDVDNPQTEVLEYAVDFKTNV